MTHQPIEGVHIGQHPLVKQALRGVYGSRPPRPRYNYTWDVKTVLVYFEKLGDNSSLSQKKKKNCIRQTGITHGLDLCELNLGTASTGFITISRKVYLSSWLRLPKEKAWCSFERLFLCSLPRCHQVVC